MRDAAEPYDVEDGQVGLRVGLLLDRGEAPGDGPAAQPGKGLAVEGDGPGVGGEDAGEQAQERGLAGAVGAEEAGDGAGDRGDADAVQDEGAAGGARDPVGAQARVLAGGGHRVLLVR